MSEAHTGLLPDLYVIASQVRDGTAPLTLLHDLLGPCWIGVEEISTASSGPTLGFRVASGPTSVVLPVMLKDGRLAVGVLREFGYPIKSLIEPHSEIEWFNVPDGFATGDLELLAMGNLPFDRFHEMVNLTAILAMQKPIERFPRACLIMVLRDAKALKRGIPQRPEHTFVLWTQRNGLASIQDLPLTDNPHIAADHARELGFEPTIYRCTSGQMVAFKATHGGPFL